MEPYPLMNVMVDALSRRLVCSRSVLETVVMTLASGGHILLDDVPGVGKTTLARAVGMSVDGVTRRIQFTPDLLPGDVTGMSVYNRATGTFAFHAGPLFANVVLADEINRANPKTQSAMLEAMGEGSVSVDGVTHELPDPVLVIATQNPIETEGTYPLPEAQLDRFMTCISMGYPTAGDEASIIMDAQWRDPLLGMKPVCSPQDVVVLRAAVDAITIARPVAEYIVAIAAATRNHDDFIYGASPRASLHIATMARAHAALRQRDYVLPDDVRAVATAVLSHRIILRNRYVTSNSRAQVSAILEDIMRTLPVPRAADR